MGRLSAKIIIAQDRNQRIQEIELEKKYNRAILERDHALALAEINKKENRLALAELSGSTVQKNYGDKRRHGNQIIMSEDPRSERTSLPPRN